MNHPQRVANQTEQEGVRPVKDVTDFVTAGGDLRDAIAKGKRIPKAAKVDKPAAAPAVKVKPRKLDQLDIARLIAPDARQDYAYDEGKLQLLEFVGTHWRPLAGERPPERMIERIGAAIDGAGQVKSKHFIESVFWFLRGILAADFTRRPDLVNFSNGTLEVETGDQHPHNRDDRLNYVLPYAYKRGDPVKILKILASVIPDEAARRAYMAHIGIALLGYNKLQTVIVLLGRPATGKSLLLALANLICGQSPNSHAGAQLFSPDTEGLRSRAQWAGQLLVTLDELPANALYGQGEEIFKLMASHGGVPMRRVYESELQDNQWRPTLLLATNNRPVFRDPSGALARRLLIVETAAEPIPKDKRNPRLLDELAAELPQFAVQCLDEAQIVITAGQYPESDDMSASRDQIEQAGDSVKAFVSACCTLDKSAWTSYGKLYGRYSGFCTEDLDGQKPVSKKRFTGTLRDRYGAQVLKQWVEGVRQSGISGIRLSDI